MSTILELREKRAKAWEAAKAFLDSHRNDKGILSAEDDAAYTRMEQEITDLGKEIARLERQEALEAESEDVFLFFSLGQCIEDLDRQLRLHQDASLTLKKISRIAAALAGIGWGGLNEAWHQLQGQPGSTQFYHFSDHIQTLFEAGA